MDLSNCISIHSISTWRVRQFDGLLAAFEPSCVRAFFCGVFGTACTEEGIVRASTLIEFFVFIPSFSRDWV